MATVAAGAVAALYLLRALWLRQLAYALLGPAGLPTRAERVDAILVPNADWVEGTGGMEALEQAASLVRGGLAGTLYMTCPDWDGVSACQLAQEALTKRGQTGVEINAIRTERLPDRLEAEFALERLNSAGVKSTIVVLPSYKGRRLAAAYRKAAERHGLRVIPLSTPVQDFDPNTWWRFRQSQKLFAYEVLRWLRLL
ncbi:MAG: hypothetical protein ACUVXB_16205 [Bryobacteraceae bacterium]